VLMIGGRQVTRCLIWEFFQDFLFEPLCLLRFFNYPNYRTPGERRSQKISLKRSFWDLSNELPLDPLCHLRFLTCASSPRPRLLPLISKDSSFETINASQISFNYFCRFKSYLGVPALSKHPIEYVQSNNNS